MHGPVSWPRRHCICHHLGRAQPHIDKLATRQSLHCTAGWRLCRRCASQLQGACKDVLWLTAACFPCTAKKGASKRWYSTSLPKRPGVPCRPTGQRRSFSVTMSVPVTRFSQNPAGLSDSGNLQACRQNHEPPSLLTSSLFKKYAMVMKASFCQILWVKAACRYGLHLMRLLLRRCSMLSVWSLA